jgi:hypothetical protein
VHLRDWHFFRHFLQDAKPPYTDQELERYVEAWSQPGAAPGMINYHRASVRQSQKEAAASFGRSRHRHWSSGGSAIPTSAPNSPSPTATTYPTYAVLSLTVVRLIPVAIAMIGTGARAGRRWPSRLVRAAWACVDRLRGAGARGGRTPTRWCDPHDDLRHDRTVGPRSRSHRGTPGQPLRGLVRVASPGCVAGLESSQVRDVLTGRG